MASIKRPADAQKKRKANKGSNNFSKSNKKSKKSDPNEPNFLEMKLPGEEDIAPHSSKKATGLSGKASDGGEVISMISTASLDVGTRVWGMILEVSPRGVVVSMTNGIRGFVSPIETSDLYAAMINPTPSKLGQSLLAAAGREDGSAPPLTDLFHIGQYVRAVVIDVTEREREVSDKAGSAAAEEDDNSDDDSNEKQDDDDNSKGESGESGNKGAKKKIKRRFVQLSLCLSRLHKGRDARIFQKGSPATACVRSIEDHGFVLSFGVKGISGFLRRADHIAAFGEEAAAALLPGMLVEVVVKEDANALMAAQGSSLAAKKRIVYVSSDPNTVAAAATPDTDVMAMDQIAPGALVSTRVTKVLSSGIAVSFMRIFNGHIPLIHTGLTGALATSSGLKRRFQEGQRHKARVLFVNPSTKQITLSFLPHLLALSFPSDVPLMGSVHRNAQVMHVDTKGVLLSLPSDDKPFIAGEEEGKDEASSSAAATKATTCGAYCHISNAFEAFHKTQKIFATYKVGATVACRVIGFRLMDNLASVSLRKSIVDAAVFRPEDVVPASVLRGCKVVVKKDKGLVVAIGPSLKGWVPLTHVSDVVTDKTFAKFKVGDKVDARVLEVDSQEKKVKLTLKKSLVESRLPPLAALHHAVVGRKFHGVVSGIVDYGVFVTFFGGMKGLAQLRDLGLPTGKHPRDVFTIGQIVKALVVSVDPTGKIRVSLASGGVEAVLAAEETLRAKAAAAQASQTDLPEVGKVYEAHVRVATGAVQNGGVPNRFFVDLFEKEKGQGGEEQLKKLKGISGMMDAAHLSDHPQACLRLQQVVGRPGVNLGEVLVLDQVSPTANNDDNLNKNNKNNARHRQQMPLFRVTRKHNLISAALNQDASSESDPELLVPQSVSQMKVGSIYPGFIASVTPVAVYVRFLNGITGKAGLPQLSDTFVADPSQLFFPGQSVRARVTEIDAVKERIQLHLKPSLTASTDAAFLATLYRDLGLADTIEASLSSQVEGKAEGEGEEEEEEEQDQRCCCLLMMMTMRTVRQLVVQKIRCHVERLAVRTAD
uniref:S1 motif domain-containing protein n=1 Tax=Polytomella parva TaxID=51329 RepID=A0A7S0UUT8_9CHLO|mmetsp:Transcript_22966/g.40580  ORF Transcript_22966/g.40580 Transcript_22966/m.40580 type:complete len:1048 (+) Transcript_22966:182-3325(+)